MSVVPSPQKTPVLLGSRFSASGSVSSALSWVSHTLAFGGRLWKGYGWGASPACHLPRPSRRVTKPLGIAKEVSCYPFLLCGRPANQK